MSEHPHLAIIILNWNGIKDSVECINSVRNNIYDNYTIILADNGSDQENLNELKKWCLGNFNTVIHYTRNEAENGGNDASEILLTQSSPDQKIIIIDNRENLGFAAGNNVALRYALKRNIKYTLLLNNDTIIEPDSISELMIFLSANTQYSVVVPQTRYFEPKDRIWNCGGKIMWYGNRRYYYARAKVSQIPKKGFKRITFATGCALLFMPVTTGLLSEKFFFGEEDFEFSLRQKKAGIRMACVFSSVIYHKVSISAAKIRGKNPAAHIFLNYLMRLIDIKQHYGWFAFNFKMTMILSYAVLLMRFKYKFSMRNIFRIIRSIKRNALSMNEVDKAYTFKILNSDLLITTNY